MPTVTAPTSSTGLEIAVVGLACRLPGARNAAEFWRNLCAGHEALQTFSAAEICAAYGFAPPFLHAPHFVPAGGVLDDIEWFDAGFFGYSPREAEVMDPQHRLLLETAWAALEDASCDPTRFAGLIGLYAGASADSYLTLNLLPNRELAQQVGEFQLSIGNQKDHLPTTVSYKLNLKGPSINVQTACSTSLVAVHLACQGLLSGECDVALAGGVSVGVPQKAGYFYEPGGINSPDGHCRAFDAQAQGTVAGSGVGVVVLKRLADALAAGDHIRAVIKGSAVNNDGAAKVGYTAPSIEGQINVIRAAQTLAEVPPETISYIEAHGTGTTLGDPIEVTALTRVFREQTAARGFCALGAVKTNIGHLDAAAGIAGLIKTVLALEHEALPPSLHFTEPNPKIDFASSPFFVNATLRSWPRNDAPRRAGVSSFGIGGTNAHVILEEAPRRLEEAPRKLEEAPRRLEEAPRKFETASSAASLAASSAVERPQLLLLSARSRTALDAAAQQLAEHLPTSPELDLATLAYTLQTGRKAFSERRALVCASLPEAAEALASGAGFTATVAATEPALVFMLPGVGTQYAGMSQGLYATEPVFRAVFDECCELLAPHLSRDLRQLVLGPYAGTDNAARAAADVTLRNPALAMPALFAVEYALARLLQHWGLHPTALIGHSLGELVAACLADVFSLPDALAIAALRGRLFAEQLPPGAMLSVRLSEAAARAWTRGALSLAAVNGPELCVLSGPVADIEAAAAELAAQQIEARPVPIEMAGHAAMVETVAGQFAAFIAKLPRQAPRLPFLSNLTGDWITASEACDPLYWGRQLSQTVRFAAGLEVLLREPRHVFLEVGPGRGLATLVRQQRGYTTNRTVLSTLRHPREAQGDRTTLLTTLGQLWLANAPIDWTALHEPAARRVAPLPTYPFERQRYWIDPPRRQAAPAAPLRLQKRANVAEWFYAPSWRQAPLPLVWETAATAAVGTWLLCAEPDALRAALAQGLRATGARVVLAQSGAGFAQISADEFTLGPSENLPRAKAGFRHLLTALATAERPLRVVQLSAPPAPGRSFNTALAFSQALAESVAELAEPATAAPVELSCVTWDTQAISGDETLNVADAALVGLSRVLTQEQPALRCRVIDLSKGDFSKGDLSKAGLATPERLRQLAAQLLAELRAPFTEPLSAYRGAWRWVAGFAPLACPALPAAVVNQSTPLPGLRQGGHYLLIGGLGWLGRQFAQALAESCQARLSLLGRTPLPARTSRTDESWTDELRQKLRAVQALEAAGSAVQLLTADVTDAVSLRAALAAAQQTFGPLHGVLYAAGPAETQTYRALTETDEAFAALHFQPKAVGARVLAAALGATPLDFCWLFSSLAAQLGGLGMGAYAAANAELDALAYAQRQLGRPWTSWNWDGWQREAAAWAATEASGAGVASFAITPAEGRQTLAYLLALSASPSALPQILISTADLPARQAQQLTLALALARQEAAANEVSSSTSDASAAHQRPALKTVYVAAATELEQRLAALWQDELNLAPVGVRDDFFELGGHSLLAVRLLTRVRREFACQVSLETFFHAPTVGGLAQAIVQAQAQQHDAAAVAALLAALEAPQ